MWPSGLKAVALTWAGKLAGPVGARRTVRAGLVKRPAGRSPSSSASSTAWSEVGTAAARRQSGQRRAAPPWRFRERSRRGCRPDRAVEVGQVDQADQVAVAPLKQAQQLVRQPRRPLAGAVVGEHGGLDAEPAAAAAALGRLAAAVGLAGHAAG